MGKLQSEFGQSANSMMDNEGTLKQIAAKVSSFDIPTDFTGNPTEFRRRSAEGLQRLLGDEYMLSVQNQSRFNLKDVLGGLPKSETPDSLNYRAGVIENRVSTAGEEIDPSRRLRNATIDTQQKFLEDAAASLRDEKIKTGTVAPNGAIKDYAKDSYKAGLLPADVANYTALTEGVVIPQDTLNKVAATPKPVEEKKVTAPAPAPTVAASAPAGP